MRFLAPFVALAALAMSGCSTADTRGQPAAAGTPQPVAQVVQVKLSESDFRDQGAPNQRREVTLRPGAQLVVTLGSNPTTGYRWTEQAANTAPDVLKQLEHAFVGPEQPIPGAGGQQRWVFQALQPGSAELTMSYGRAWEVERKGSWTLGLKVTVKP